MAMLGALCAQWARGLENDVYCQVGLVMLVGLASKNAILIVEFAKVQRHEGMSRREATLAACKLRLRPIVMTSFAFILGVVPLILSHGAGAEMRRTLGTAVFSGMLGVTLFGIVLTPVFFFAIDWLGESPLFASRFMRQASRVTLGVTTLGVRWVARALAARNGRAKTTVPAAGKGKAMPNGEDKDGNGNGQFTSDEKGVRTKS
jgi:predicted RND superfamily exporter protein